MFPLGHGQGPIKLEAETGPDHLRLTMQIQSGKITENCIGWCVTDSKSSGQTEPLLLNEDKNILKTRSYYWCIA